MIYKNNEYFYDRNVYRSTATGFESHCLSDFRFDHQKLNAQIIKWLAGQDLPKVAENDGYYFSRQFAWVNGVDLVLPSGMLQQLPPTDNFEWYKQFLVAELTDKLLACKNCKNLLMLSGGVDCQLLLAICLINQIPFTGVHFTKDLTHPETEYLLTQKKLFNFDIEIVHVDDFTNDEIMQTIWKYSVINPEFGVSLRNSITWAHGLKQVEFNGYDTVITGLRAEFVLASGTPEALYNLDDVDFLQLNQKYGGYYTYVPETQQVLNFKNIWGTYKNWSNSNLRGIGAPHKSLFAIEEVSKKTFISPYLNQSLHSAALCLIGEAKLKNIFKHAQIEILKDFGITTMAKSFSILDVMYCDKIPNNETLAKLCVKNWVKNYFTT